MTVKLITGSDTYGTMEFSNPKGSKPALQKADTDINTA